MEVRPSDIRSWFEVSAPTARTWLHDWMDEGFIEPASTEQGQRIRRYRLTARWRGIIESGMAAVAGSGE